MADAVIGRGYLQVVPKMDKGALDTELSKAGKSGSSAFTDSFKGDMTARSVAIGNVMSSALIAGVENASELAGQVFADAFSNYAEFEQLAGGVEKIFNDMDNSRIFEDAENAWRDLNMSANDYISTINQVGATFSATMGDERGYDTARKGMKAIADFASGTGLDLDLLNDKFKLITRSTSSYQTVCDQFAGLLPQTNKDFLEQAQAAGYLSAEYKKLTDVPIDQYQAAVVEMLEKGTKEFGLYGNTAEETAKTVSGSIAGLKAAWDNWLTGIANSEADMDKLTDDLVEAIGYVVDNALPRIQQIAERIGPAVAEAISGALHDISPELGDTFDKFAEGAGKIAEGLGRIVDQAAASGVLDAIATGIINIGDAIANVDLGPFFNTLADMLGKLNELAVFLRDWNLDAAMENGGMYAEMFDPSTWHMFDESVTNFRKDLEALGTTTQEYGKLTDAQMRQVADAYRTNGQDMEAALASIGLKVDETTGKIVELTALDLEDKRAYVIIDTSDIDIAKRAWDVWEPMTKYAKVIVDSVTGKAEGGFAKLHAAGDFITNGITNLGRDRNGVTHIAGEDGREWVMRHADGTTSIVPIENRKYLKPYAQEIASMIGAGNPTVINLNLNYDASDDAAALARGVARKLGAIMDMRG